MTIPDAAIEAAAEALGPAIPGAAAEAIATDAIEAALPAIREAVAQEIEAARDVVLITVAEAEGKDPFSLTVADRNHLDRIAAEFMGIVRGGTL